MARQFKTAFGKGWRTGKTPAAWQMPDSDGMDEGLVAQEIALEFAQASRVPAAKNRIREGAEAAFTARLPLVNYTLDSTSKRFGAPLGFSLKNR